MKILKIIHFHWTPRGKFLTYPKLGTADFKKLVSSLETILYHSLDDVILKALKLGRHRSKKRQFSPETSSTV